MSAKKSLTSVLFCTTICFRWYETQAKQLFVQNYSKKLVDSEQESDKNE